MGESAKDGAGLRVWLAPGGTGLLAGLFDAPFPSPYYPVFPLHDTSTLTSCHTGA